LINSSETSAVDPANEISNIDWPDGWFLFEHGVVRGPFSTRETFTQKTSSQDSSSFMVSRKGFGRWYSLNDLASVYKRGDHLGIANLSTVEDVENELFQAIQTLTKLQDRVKDSAQNSLNEIKKMNQQISDSAASLSSPSVNKGPVKARDLSPSNKVNASQVSSSETASAASPKDQAQKSFHLKENSKKTETLRRNGQENLTKKQPKNRNANKGKKNFKLQESRNTARFGKDSNAPETITSQKEAASVGKSVRVSAGKQNREIAYHHMMMAGRLRLGPINNPWTEAFAKFFAGFGFYWGIWIRKTAMATTMHLDGSVIPNSSRLLWLSLIPGYHMVMAHKVARAVLSLEKQNGYKTVSPKKAVWLSIIPPFAIFYLQSALNRHWKLHVENEVKMKSK